MQNEFDEFKDFQCDLLGILRGGATEWALARANLELSLHINAKLNRIEERLSLMETQDDQLLAIDKQIVTDFAALAPNVAAILAKLNTSPVATTDPVVAEVIGDLGTLDTGVQALNTQLAAALPVPAPADPNAPAA